MPASEALAAAARQRRAELRMSQEDVRRESGLSVTTIGKIERGDPVDIIQPATLRRLDLALRWPVGTAESWYAGRGGVLSPSADQSGLARMVEELAPLVAAQLRVERERSTLSTEGLPEDVVVALEHLLTAIRNSIVHGVYR